MNSPTNVPAGPGDDAQPPIDAQPLTAGAQADGTQDDPPGGAGVAPPGEQTGQRTGEPAPQAPARSPAEAFTELAAEIAQTRREVAQVADFVRGAGSTLHRTADELFLEGADAAIRGLLRIDDLLFKQTRQSNGSQKDAPGAELAALLRQALDGELRSLDIQILEPAPGDDLDLSRMVTIANVPIPLLRCRRAGTVAEVISRGYVYSTASVERILKKAEVVIWRARSDVPIEAPHEASKGEIHEQAASGRD
jgi:hypothetical protein